MADVQISELNDTSGVSSTDLLATKKGSNDLKATVDQVGNFIIENNLSPEKVLELIKEVDSNDSGLNSQFLQGLTPEYLRTSSNLIGAIPEALLPSGSYYRSNAQGGNWGTGRSSNVLKFPENIFGTKLMVQFGYTYYTGNSGRQLITFPEPFASGYTYENKPLVILSPECRADLTGGTPWNGLPKDGDTWEVELDMRLYYTDLTQFAAVAIRTEGRNVDTVRGNWIAIGRYA